MREASRPADAAGDARPLAPGHRVRDPARAPAACDHLPPRERVDRARPGPRARRRHRPRRRRARYLPAGAAGRPRAADPRHRGPLGARRAAPGGPRHRVPAHGPDDPRAPHRAAHGQDRRRLRDPPASAVGRDRRGALAGVRRDLGPRRRERGEAPCARTARPVPSLLRRRRAGPRRGRLGPRGAHRPRVVGGSPVARPPAARRRLPRAHARRLGGPGAARAVVGRQVAARAGRRRHRLQRSRRRGDRCAHRAAPPAGGGGRRLSPAPRPGAAGRDEHERRVRVGQEHDAAAAAPARGRARPRLARLRRGEPRHLAQVPARLRLARRGVQVRRRLHRSRARDRRPQARPLHGAPGRARGHAASPDRPVPVRQLRARLERGGQQPPHPLRPRGLHVLHDHAAARDGRARLGAGPRVRPLQGGRRHARAQRRGLLGDARPLLHLGAARRHVGALRVPRQQRAARRAAAHRRLRPRRRAERARREVPARRRRATARSTSMRPARTRSTPAVEPWRRRATCSSSPTVFAGCPRSTLPTRASGRVYARTESGRLAWIDPEALARAIADADTRAGILAVVPEALGEAAPRRAAETLQPDRFHTLGDWGRALSPAAAA